MELFESSFRGGFELRISISGTKGGSTIADHARKSLIRIRREKQAEVREYQVIIDDMTVGEIGNVQEAEFPIEPGPHRIVLKMGWSRSGEICIHAKPGKLYGLVCGTPISTGLTLFYIFAILSVPFILRHFRIVITIDYGFHIIMLIMLSILWLIISLIPSTQVYLKRDMRD